METPTPSSRALAPSTSSTARKRPLSPTSTPRADLTASSLRRTHLSSAFTASMSSRTFDRQLFDAHERARQLEADLGETRARLQKVEADRAWLVGKEEEVRRRAEREVERLEKAREKEGEEMRRLRKAEAELRVGMAEREEEVERLRGRAEREQRQGREQREMWERKVQGLEEMLGEVRERDAAARREASELRVRVLELEEELAHALAHTRSSPRPGEEDLTLIRGELHRQGTHLRSLEAENARLKLDMGGWREKARECEVLREEVRDWRRRAKEGEERGREVAHLRAELDARTKEMERLSTQPASSSSSPSSLTSQLSSLRLSQTTLQSRLSTLTLQLSSAQASLAEAEARAEEAEKGWEEERRRREGAEEREGRERRARERGEREVRELEALLASYSSEFALLPTPTPTPTSPTPSNPISTLQSQRLAQLDTLVSELKAENSSLLAELNSKPSPAVVDRGVDRQEADEARREAEEARAAQEAALLELTQLRASLEKLEEAKEHAEQRLFELGEKIADGNYVPPGERVLQLASNPVSDHFAVRASQLSSLRAERDALLRKRLEMGVGEREWVPRESWEEVRREKEGMEEEARGREKRMLRLKQVFAAKATEFREAVTSILGYKLNFSGNGRVRLTSIYDPSTALVFQSSDDNSNTGSMRLIGIGDSEDAGLAGEGEGVVGGMQFWVRERGSIPCFLAALTIECFERTTVGRRAGWKAPGGEEGVVE